MRLCLDDLIQCYNLRVSSSPGDVSYYSDAEELLYPRARYPARFLGLMLRTPMFLILGPFHV